MIYGVNAPHLKKIDLLGKLNRFLFHLLLPFHNRHDNIFLFFSQVRKIRRWSVFWWPQTCHFSQANESTPAENMTINPRQRENFQSNLDFNSISLGFRRFNLVFIPIKIFDSHEGFSD